MRKRFGVTVLSLCLVGAAIAGGVAGNSKELDRLSNKDEKIVLAFKGESLQGLFGVIEKAANVSVSFGDGFPANKKVTLNWEKTLKQALMDLAEENSLTYEVSGPDSLLVKGASTKP